MDKFKRGIKTFFIIMAFVLINVLIDALTGALVPSLIAILMTGDPLNSIDYLAYGLLAGQLVKFTILVFYIEKRDRTYRALDKRYIQRGKLAEPIKLVGIGLGTVGFGLTFTNIIMKVFENTELLKAAQNLMENAFNGVGIVSNLVIFIVAVVGAPIVEELLFRGVLFEEIRNECSLKMTIFLTALVFGIYHFNIIQTPNTFFMGLVLAYVYYKTGTIRAPIIIHATNNILATIPIIDQGLTPLGITINIVLIVIGLYSLITLRKIS